VPEEILKEILGKKLEETKKGIILDGTPRNKEQKKMLEEIGIKKSQIIVIEVREEIVIERISNRRTCNKCKRVYNTKTNPPKKEGICDDCGSEGKIIIREDDKTEAIKKRLRIYREETEPMVKEYEKEGRVIRINGEPPIEEVREEVMKRLVRGKKMAVLYSGGKDSNLAMLYAKRRGDEIACLITIESENKESYMYHTPAITQTKKQAEALGIPIITTKTKGIKEEELKELKEAIKEAIEKYGVEGIVTGAIESVYQASRIGKIAEEEGIECYNPLWKKPQKEVLQEIIDEGWEVIIVGTGAEGLDERWLGRRLHEPGTLSDLQRLEEKYGINIAGEGGEYESLVLWMPMFNKELKVKKKEIIREEGGTARLIVELE